MTEEDEDQEFEAVKFQTRQGLAIKTLTKGQIEVAAGTENLKLPAVALSILQAFMTPQAIDEGSEAVAGEAGDAKKRYDVDETVAQMLRAEILIPEPTDEEAPKSRVSHGYAAPKIHVAMLRDEARTLSYLAAIRESVGPDDVVVDIGTGTGVLAVAAAEAGARQVYAVEANPGTAVFARALFADSPHGDRIQLIEGWSTEVTLPERCDVLVSEMIGDDPLDENILAMTSDAIARHLKPSPRLIPASLDIFAQPVLLPDWFREQEFFCEADVLDWEKKYGLRFQSLLGKNPPQTVARLLPQDMRDWDMVGKPLKVASIDLARSWHNVINDQLTFELGDGFADGLAIYFETCLSASQQLSTHPLEAGLSNHWQTPCYLFHEKFTQQLHIDYRYGVSTDSDGVYLQGEDCPEETEDEPTS
jgi:hypothetical protein